MESPLRMKGTRLRKFFNAFIVNMRNDTPTNIFYSSHHSKGDVLVTGKLTNKIHHLFDIPLRKAVSNFSVVEQSARLASHFVQCGVLDRIFVAIANKGKPGRSWQDRKGSQVGLEIPQEELTRTKRTDGRMAQSLLIHLSQNISYTFDNTVKDHGVTESIPNRNHVDQRFKNAEKSIIRLAASLYDELEKAQCTADTPLVLNLQVDLAITLVHEIAHALDNLAHGKLWHGHFLGHNMIREVGFDIETQLFGGHLTTLFGSKNDPNSFRRYYYDRRQLSALTGIIVLWEYPYQSLANAYRHESHMEIRGEPKDVRALDIAWRVPVTFLGQLFQESFWDDEVKSDATALRPNCSVGYTFRADRDGNSIPVIKHEDDDSLMYVPEGYLRLKDDGSIVLDDPNNDDVVNTTNFWECMANIYSSDDDRPWKVIRKGSENFEITHMVCEEYMDGIVSDTEMADP